MQEAPAKLVSPTWCEVQRSEVTCFILFHVYLALNGTDLCAYSAHALLQHMWSVDAYTSRLGARASVLLGRQLASAGHLAALCKAYATAKELNFQLP